MEEKKKKIVIWSIAAVIFIAGCVAIYENDKRNNDQQQTSQEDTSKNNASNISQEEMEELCQFGYTEAINEALGKDISIINVLEYKPYFEPNWDSEGQAYFSWQGKRKDGSAFGFQCYAKKENGELKLVELWGDSVRIR